MEREEGARKLEIELVFVLESGAGKIFEERMDALICSLSLNGLKTAKVR